MKLGFYVAAFGLMSMLAYAQESTPPPRVYPVALPNYDEETATRLQIFLDNSDFGPGKIDGKMGEFFRKALISYKHAQAMPKTGAVDQVLPLNEIAGAIERLCYSRSRDDRRVES